MFKRKFGAIWLGYILLLVFLACRQVGKISTIQSTSTSTMILPTTYASANSPNPGMTTRYLTLDGRQRSYILYIPPTYNPSQASAVVFILHGGLGLAHGMLDITGFNDQSDRSEIIAVCPNDTGRQEDRLLTWNASRCCGYAQEQNIDDVDFIRQLIKDLTKIVNVDPERIYVPGLSNGAMMSYRLTCELSDQMAAIAPVAGTQNIDVCQPDQPVSIIHFHGTADQHAPYDGGIDPKSLTTLNHAPVEETIAFWVKQDSCPTKPITESFGHIIHDYYTPCQQGTGVAIYIIEGGGHAWPGGEAWREGADQPTQEISATALIWEFFAAYPKS